MDWRLTSASLLAVSVGIAVISVSLYDTTDDAASPLHAAAAATGGDPARGYAAFDARGCSACHTVSGRPLPHGRAGPDLTGISHKAFLAGRLTNTPDNLIRWIRHPQSIDPMTAMPDIGLDDPTVRDLAAYLLKG